MVGWREGLGSSWCVQYLLEHYVNELIYKVGKWAWACTRAGVIAARPSTTAVAARRQLRGSLVSSDSCCDESSVQIRCATDQHNPHRSEHTAQINSYQSVVLIFQRIPCQRATHYEQLNLIYRWCLFKIQLHSSVCQLTKSFEKERAHKHTLTATRIQAFTHCARAVARWGCPSPTTRENIKINVQNR